MLQFWRGAILIAVAALAVAAYEIDRRSKSVARTFTNQIASLTQEIDALKVGPRGQINCDRSAGVIVTLGQSQAANAQAEFYMPRLKVSNFDFRDGDCYRARDPLRGTDGDGGNFSGQVGDLLIERQVFKSVIVAPIAVSGTRIEQWVPGAVHNGRILAMAARLADAHLKADAVLWWQGEANATDESPSPYVQALASVIDTFRSSGIGAPFIVARSTRCGTGEWPTAHNIREAQAAIVTMRDNVFAGPDTDTLGLEYRVPDNCHFGGPGPAAVARMWVDSITAALAATKKTRPQP